MQDLLVGVAVIGLLSAILFVASFRVARSLPPRLVNLISIFLITLMIAFILLVHGRIALTHMLPFSNVIVVGNWQPLIAATFAAFIWRHLHPALWRRTLVLAALVVSCLYGMYEPILGKTPELGEKWQDGVCLQTSPASCTAAAAATILDRHGIVSTEQEMALLCLTTTEGTSFHGLYRGLKLKTAGSPWDVYMFADKSIDELRRMGAPAILSVELRPNDGLDPRYQNTFGWLPGVPHTIVLTEFIDDHTVRIADPALGYETWTIEDLKLLWHGEGARLVRASSAP